MDKATVIGLVVAMGAILGGQALEGGHAGSLVQLTAALIVFGGTAGATMVAFPMGDLKRGLQLSRAALTDKKSDTPALVSELLELAAVARRDGVLALEARLPEVKDPFLRRALQFVVDGVDSNLVRSSLETEVDVEHDENTVGAKVFEAAGGYAPTVGILGAVLGLIHVMENLDDPSKLGPGIAVAFVATVYGVGVSNLVLLPMATKIKRRLGTERERKNLILEGVLAIQEGINPRILEERLKGFTPGHSVAKGPPAPGAQGQGAAPAGGSARSAA